MQLLIVEDNPGIAANVYDYLSAHGHDVEVVSDGLTGLGAAASGNFDVVILDVRLPRLSGLDLCRRLRHEHKLEVPVLMLTAMDSLDDKLEGFGAGADDYLVKPFALKELEARLMALAARRAGRVVRRQLTFGRLVYDAESMTVRRDGEELRLPPKCVRIVAAMMEQPQHTFTRSELERIGWNNEEASPDTLRTHVSILRRALQAPGLLDPIQTLHGVGYRMNPAYAVVQPDPLLPAGDVATSA